MPNTQNPLISAPGDQILFILGGLGEKIDGVARAQEVQRESQVKFQTEMRDEMGTARQEISAIRARVDVVESKHTPKTPWYTFAGGISGLIAIVLGAINFVRGVTP